MPPDKVSVPFPQFPVAMRSVQIELRIKIGETKDQLIRITIDTPVIHGVL